MVDVSPFRRVLRKKREVLVLNPSHIVNPIDSTIGAIAYEIHDGSQLVTRTGILLKNEGADIPISSITKIKVVARSALRQLGTFGAKDITFSTSGSDKETWHDVPNPDKVKRLINALKQHGPEYLKSTNLSKSKESEPALSQQPERYIHNPEILPRDEESGDRHSPAPTYNDYKRFDYSDRRVDKSIHIDTLNVHNGHNFSIVDDTALRTDLEGNPLVMQGEYDPKVGTNIAAAKDNPDDKDVVTTSIGTLQHFKHIASLPAGFRNFDDTEKSAPVTEIFIDPDGYLVTSIVGNELNQAWDMVIGKPVKNTLNYTPSAKFATTTFYDGRHKTIALLDGQIHLPYENDYSILTAGAWASIKNKELTKIAGAMNGSRTRLIAASDKQGIIHVTHTTLAQQFNIEITKHGSELVYLNWAGQKYQGTNQQIPGQSWLTTHLTSASMDGTIRVWDVENEQELGRFLGHNVANPAIAENDTHFAYADQHGYVHVYERLER